MGFATVVGAAGLGQMHGYAARAMTATSFASPSLTELWSLAGLARPSAVLLDAAREVLYVSNVDGDPTEKNGTGFITRVTPAGEMVERAWVGGLHAPKGLALSNDGSRLYTADIDVLVEIDVATGEVTARHPVEGAELLSDVAVAPDGTVYVCDLRAGRIHRLRDGTLETWLEGEQLDNPSGLYAEADHLVVSTWGSLDKQATDSHDGIMLRISYADGTVIPLGAGVTIGSLSGVKAAGNGDYYVTDWDAGTLLKVSEPDQDTAAKCNVKLFKYAELSLDARVANHEYDADEQVLFIPLMLEDRLVAYGWRMPGGSRWPGDMLIMHRGRSP